MACVICVLLQDRIKDFLIARSESQRWFSRQVEVDYSTIYRILTGEQKTLSFFNAYKILKFMSPDNYLAVLGDCYPDETGELLTREKAIEDKSSLAAEVLTDPFAYRVFQFATNTPGVTAAVITHEYGLQGGRVIQQFLEKNVLESNPDGTFFNKLEGSILINEGELKRMASLNIDLFNLQTPGAHIHNISGGLNERGLGKAYSAGMDYIARVKEILAAEDLKGNTVYLSTISIGPMDCRKAEGAT